MNLITKRKNNLSPFHSIEDWQSDLNKFFDSSMLNLPVVNENHHTNWLPDTDIQDHGDKFIIQTDLPGLNKKDIDITVQGNTLFIKGEKKRDNQSEDIGYLRSERFFGQFERALALSNDIDVSKVKASYKDGILTVTIAKKEEARPRQISIDIS